MESHDLYCLALVMFAQKRVSKNRKQTSLGAALIATVKKSRDSNQEAGLKNLHVKNVILETFVAGEHQSLECTGV